MRKAHAGWIVVGSLGWVLALTSVGIAQQQAAKRVTPPATEAPASQAVQAPAVSTKTYSLKIEWAQTTGNDTSRFSLVLPVNDLRSTRSREQSNVGENRVVFHDFEARVSELPPNSVDKGKLLLTVDGEFQVVESNGYRGHEISVTLPISVGETVPLRTLSKPSGTTSRETQIFATLTER